ncbi:fatty-acyl-CoA synthase [Paraburkholderia unamae]|uniref:AMP-binding protein n=1 Tax=Paraburkholderia unamae TaxID=219649 RepID=UPI000DC3F2E3|nr:AMP-binding protein [Paraburkholderia unamae]RAR53362.1 fatty-acyl-CoA synthase [Paraburkholderia unamae]
MTRSRTFNLADLLEIVTARVPERAAFVCGPQRLTYAQLDERATRVASGLRSRGIRRGDHVGIALYNSAEYLETLFACCKIGAVPVNVNYRYVASELEYLFSTLDFKALVYGEAFGEEVLKAAANVPALKVLLCVGSGAPEGRAEHYATLREQGSPTLDDPERSGDDLYMLCTGGTTGMPKGVMWPQRAIFMGALGGGGMYLGCPPVETPEALGELIARQPYLTVLAAAPMMHGAAMWFSLISLFAGHTIVVNDETGFDPAHIWDVVVRDGVNVVSVVGDAMALPLIQALEAAPARWDLGKLMVFGNGGAVFSDHLQARLKALVPHIALNNGLGSSEVGVVGGGAKPASGDGFMVLAARPDLALVDDAQRIVSGAGAEGVLARSGHTPIGYYGDPVKSAEVFVTIDGKLWVLSGDRARMDEAGNFVMLGRGSQCINTGGEKVFPEEVEEAARRYGAVQDVLVVGMPDERWGQRVAAVIELSPGAEFDAQEFDSVCRARLSGYKMPRAVFLADRIRRSPAGKADYRWARDYAAQNASVI